jgi:hypothetical protein
MNPHQNVNEKKTVPSTAYRFRWVLDFLLNGVSKILIVFSLGTQLHITSLFCGAVVRETNQNQSRPSASEAMRQVNHSDIAVTSRVDWSV